MAITRIGSYGQLKGTAYKLPCRLATTATVTLSTPPSSVDGITIQDGDRILVWKQSNAAENGIYVSEASDWTRAVDFSIDDDVLNGIQVYVNEGDTYFKTAFALENTGVITLGTTLLVFNPISSGSGAQGPQGFRGFQGFQGPQGIQGNKGGLLYSCNSGATSGWINIPSPIGDGTIRIDNVTADGATVYSYISSWQTGGTLVIQSNTNGDSTYAIFTVNSITVDNVFPTGVEFIVGVEYVSGDVPATGEICVVNFSFTGPKGDTCISYTVDYPTPITPGFPGTITFDYTDCLYNPTSGSVNMGGSVTFSAVSGSVTNYSSPGTNLTEIGIDRGPQGLQGPQGFQGFQGPQGIQGNTGPAGSLGYSTWFGNISQTGANDPIATAVGDTLGYPLNWTRGGAGTYYAEAIGAPAGFLSIGLWCTTPSESVKNSNFSLRYKVIIKEDTSDPFGNTLVLTTMNNSGVFADDLLLNQPVEIRLQAPP